MSDTIELNDKLVSELRDIAKSLGIADTEELRKAQLITAIVEQQNLIEAARAQQNSVANNYAPITAANTETADSGEKTRKRIRTVKTNSKEPRVEVPLDDTNLFDMADDESQPEDEQEEGAELDAAPVNQ